ncbi:MAG: metal-dependent hydrolase [Bacteroidota bacterium]
MDSLTQITLGAAVGEVVLGRKAGNRALLYGAIGGTVPDLDVIANLFTDEMTALALHRGLSHSVFFACTAPIALGWLTHKLYSSGLYKDQRYKAGNMTFWLILYGLAAVGFYFAPMIVGGEPNIGVAIGSVIVGLLLFLLLRTRYYNASLEAVDASWKEWSWLYFWAILTHSLLDACTTYGTQLLEPFSNYRVAFNNISVVDPIYTVPFIICLIIVSQLPKSSSRRRFFNYLGIGLSSLYLLLTFANKWRVDQVFERSLAEQQVNYSRYMTAPTIFNNALWHGIAEGDTAYYSGLYSIFDSEAKFQILNVMPKRRHLIEGHEADRDIEILEWFSNGYYNALVRKDGQLQLNDLRFGIIGERAVRESDFVFRFILEENNGELKASQDREDSFEEGTFGMLWERIKGR